MLETIYERDSDERIHCGAIYQYRPIPWLEPPLWLLRDIQWTPPRYASVHDCEELQDAFRRYADDNQEDIVARAKRRYVLVLTSTSEARYRGVKQVIVAPAYTFDQDDKPDFVAQVKRDKIYHTFYLAEDPDFPDVRECYLNFRQVQPMDKRFLNEGNLSTCIVPAAMSGILRKYRNYLKLGQL